MVQATNPDDPPRRAAETVVDFVFQVLSYIWAIIRFLILIASIICMRVFHRVVAILSDPRLHTVIVDFLEAVAVFTTGIYDRLFPLARK